MWFTEDNRFCLMMVFALEIACGRDNTKRIQKSDSDNEICKAFAKKVVWKRIYKAWHLFTLLREEGASVVMSV